MKKPPINLVGPLTAAIDTTSLNTLLAASGTKLDRSLNPAFISHVPRYMGVVVFYVLSVRRGTSLCQISNAIASHSLSVADPIEYLQFRHAQGRGFRQWDPLLSIYYRLPKGHPTFLFRNKTIGKIVLVPEHYLMKLDFKILLVRPLFPLPTET